MPVRPRRNSMPAGNPRFRF